MTEASLCICIGAKFLFIFLNLNWIFFEHCGIQANIIDFVEHVPTYKSIRLYSCCKNHLICERGGRNVSLIRDIIENVRSFKTESGLANFCYNLFTYFNNRYFATGNGGDFRP